MTRPHIARERLYRIGILFAVWTAYGLLCTWQAHYWYAFTSKPWTWTECLRAEMTYAWLWGMATPAVLWCARRFRLERPDWPRHLAAHAALLVVLLPTIKLIYDLIARRRTRRSFSSRGRSCCGRLN